MNMKFIKEGFYVILLFSLFDTRSHISYCFSIKSSFYSCLIELRISYCEHKMMLGMKAKNCVSCVLSDWIKFVTYRQWTSCQSYYEEGKHKVYEEKKELGDMQLSIERVNP